MTTSPHLLLPGSLRQAVGWEMRTALRRPFTVPLVVTFNALLMAGAWFLLPVRWQDWLFSLHGPAAFAMVLAFWMYADVPATNVLAPDRVRVLAALDDPVVLRRLLYAKNIVLWCFVAPFCTVVAVVVAVLDDQWPPVLVTLTAVGVVPFGVLGVAGWIGILWPYHPRELRFRWEHRRQLFRVVVRWLVLVLVPYGVVPALGVIVLLPSLLVWRMLSGGHIVGLPTDNLVGGVLLAGVVSTAAFWGGYAVSMWLVRRRGDDLRAYLTDPDRG